MTQKQQMEFFFDVGSPYSYLAATQLQALSLRTSTPVRWRPFLLGAVFRATGNEMPARVAAKARWMLGDLHRWARYYDVPFSMSSHFPLNTLKPQRALAGAAALDGEQVLPALGLGLFRAYWVDDQDVSDEAVIASVAAAAGLDGAAVVQSIGQQAVKDALRANTDEAVSRGAFGAPLIFVGEEMFWGNDRLRLVEHLLTQQQQ